MVVKQRNYHTNRRTSEDRNTDEARRLAEQDAVAQARQAEGRDETLSETDELLDEIDGLLEENAEAFLTAYRQQAGQ